MVERAGLSPHLYVVRVYPPPSDDHGVSTDDAQRALEALTAAGELELPVLPDAAAVILAETGKADWDAHRVVDAVRRDAAMSAHLLRLANSAALGGASRIVSVQHAITRLGGSSLRQIALVIACETRAFSAAAFEAEVRALFRHSLATALAARAIAKARRTNVEEAFLAGLLHDLGWPVVIHALAPQVSTLGRGPVLEVARAHHPAIGATVARAWRLPPVVVQAIEDHHRADAAGLAATVALADVLAAHLDADGAVVERALSEAPATQALNLYPEAIAALIGARSAIASEAAAW